LNEIEKYYYNIIDYVKDDDN